MTLPLLARQAEPPTLRLYQEEAVAAIRERYVAGDHSTLLVLATGLGKTICFAEIARRTAERGGRVLVLAHRTELLEQAIGKLESLGLDVGWEQAQSRANERHGVVVASVQTLKGKRLERWSRDHFSLVVIDEAHHAAAATYRRIIEHFHGHVLGVTATPDRGDGKGLRELFDSVAYRYEIKEGIESGWLAPISARRIMVDGLDLSAVRSVAGDLNQGDLDLAMRAPEAVHGVAEPLLEMSEERPTLAFTVTVEHARGLSEAINEMRPGTAAALDGSASREHRADVLRQYHSGDVRVLLNCALFTEGFDAPSTSCIAIARPTKSRALYAQMVGRGTRLAPGKKDCRVLDFAGIAGKHSLIGPADVLAGEPLDGDEKTEVEQILEQGGRDVFMALEEGKERARKKREASKPEPIAWTSLEVDLFADSLSDGYRSDWEGLKVTAKQAEYLERKGVEIDRLDKAHASALIETLKERQAQDLCTYKQAKVLSKYGIKARGLSFRQASELIDSLASQRWRPSPQWVAKAQRTAEAAAHERNLSEGAEAR